MSKLLLENKAPEIKAMIEQGKPLVDLVDKIQAEEYCKNESRQVRAFFLSLSLQLGCILGGRSYL